MLFFGGDDEKTKKEINGFDKKRQLEETLHYFRVVANIFRFLI